MAAVGIGVGVEAGAGLGVFVGSGVGVGVGSGVGIPTVCSPGTNKLRTVMPRLSISVKQSGTPFAVSVYVPSLKVSSTAPCIGRPKYLAYPMSEEKQIKSETSASRLNATE